MKNKNPSLTSLAAFFLIVTPFVYVSAYYMSVERGYGYGPSTPRYRVIGEAGYNLFRPIHRIDLKLRRDFWWGE